MILLMGQKDTWTTRHNPPGNPGSAGKNIEINTKSITGHFT